MITVDDIVNVTKTLPDKKTNPVRMGTCVYTDYDGSHCIAGEILEQLGCDLPSVDDLWNEIPVTELVNIKGIWIENEALSLLENMQRLADTATLTGEKDAWRSAKEAIVAYLPEENS